MRRAGQWATRRAMKIARPRHDNGNCTETIDTTPPARHRDFGNQPPKSRLGNLSPAPKLCGLGVGRDFGIGAPSAVASLTASGIRPLSAFAAAGRHTGLVAAIFAFKAFVQRPQIGAGFRVATPVGPNKAMRVRAHAAQTLALKRGRGNSGHVGILSIIGPRKHGCKSPPSCSRRRASSIWRPSNAASPGQAGRCCLGCYEAWRDQLAANFISLMASKSCTPPPTRLVV